MDKFLRSNKYVSFSTGSLISVIAKTMTREKSAEETVQIIHEDLKNRMLYDFMRAKTVQKGYVPNLDSVYIERKGICFDIASLFCGMLRACGVPCKLIIGWADKEYHAWNEVLINNKWVRYDITAEITGIKFIVYKKERTY